MLWDQKSYAVVWMTVLQMPQEENRVPISRLSSNFSMLRSIHVSCFMHCPVVRRWYGPDSLHRLPKVNVRLSSLQMYFNQGSVCHQTQRVALDAGLGLLLASGLEKCWSMAWKHHHKHQNWVILVPKMSAYFLRVHMVQIERPDVSRELCCADQVTKVCIMIQWHF